MKTIFELTEKEILKLTSEDIELMIKQKKAQEGIMILDAPIEPQYHEIEKPDLIRYTCSLFGKAIAFNAIEDMSEFVSLIENKEKCKLETEWNILGGSIYYEIKKFSTYQDWRDISTENVYSKELYEKIRGKAIENKQMKDEYEKQLSEYNKNLSESKWVEDEINEKVNNVKDKYSRLNLLCSKMKIEYMPLAENNETIAIGFLDKAYILTEEQKDYVLQNYKTTK